MGQEPLIDKVLRALGINPVQLRWKLRRRAEKREREKRSADNKRQALDYAHKLCEGCGQPVDRDERKCPHCGHKLASQQAVRVQRRLKAWLPFDAISYARVFAAINVVFFLVMMMRSGGFGSLRQGIDPKVAVNFGAWVVPLVVGEGQWWRLVTSIFLHLGLLHIIFNTMWLMDLGPAVESVIGRQRFLFLYLFSGAFGFLLSVEYRVLTGKIIGYGAGASGAVFGLIAAALVLGYIRKAPGAQAFRNGLIRWAIFGVIFSFIPGIDLWAHLGGAVAGGVCALVVATESDARRAPAWAWGATEILCIVVIVGSVAFAVRNQIF